MKFIITIVICLFTASIFSQTIQEYYEQSKFGDVVKLASKKKTKLSKEDMYAVGRSYFNLENDKMAVEFYDFAIQMGLSNGDVYFFKGLSLRWLGKFKKAVESYNKALGFSPKNQTWMSEKALAFYYDENLDSALYTAQQAVKLPYEIGMSYYLAAHIPHVKKDFTTALTNFYEAFAVIDPRDEYYTKTLMDIGQLEYTTTKNFEKSAKAYSTLLALNPKNYEIYPKLLKAYHGCKNYPAADSLFATMKQAYERNELSEEYMKYGSVAIDEFKWNKQRINCYKYFKTPEKTLDIIYKFYLLTPKGDKVQRTLQTEQTIQIGDGAKHLLCEQGKDGKHFTYPFGWTSDDIDYDSLKKAVISVLDKNTKPQASSNFGGEK